MKISLHIEADNTADLDAAIAGLAKTLVGVTQVSASIVDPNGNAPVDAAPPVEKKTRAKKTEAEAPKATEPEKVPDKPKAETKTADEIKSYVIDWLNDLTEVENKKDAPDPEVRVKALRGLTKHIAGDVVKLSEMIADHKAKWQDIIAYVDEKRAELKPAETTGEEE
jgi:hypothetical protein